MSAPEAADDLLFGQTLACQERVRAGFSPQRLQAHQIQSLCLRAETALGAIAVIEDSRSEDEEATQGPALRRIEAKLDLLLTLIGNLGRMASELDEVALQWSALGVRLPYAPHQDSHIGLEDSGVFRIQAAPWLPEPLALPARVIAYAPSADAAGQLWLRFEPLTPGVCAALERHLFRRHRRAVAERRRSV
ncbi:MULTISPECIES: PilZ domain-containing protein [Thermomonas]|uniref:Atypical PilZ domain-containing protein, cyclic di-GMP receptor n=1 Tax=Thermomonas hydrothermalis TaxID=213588 RepID=A0A1M5ATN8_9GAMM|nr:MULTISPECIES: PilZ domain-containing protein [Thermomonas]SHF33506.1 Atypical PilZ domain-containing protein, cyclic di-GMP receptor [Thermomonas hydrothermalis]